MSSISQIEPMIPSDRGISESALPTLAQTLERKAAKLSGMAHPITAQVLEQHMRIINSYYSNLIEGNSIHPHEIRKAMQGEYSNEPAKRDLQLESLAHIRVQDYLAQHYRADQSTLTNDFLKPDCFKRIHLEFYKTLPEALRVVAGNSGQTKQVIPGRFRQPGEEVEVGNHVAPQAEYVLPYLDRFTKAYNIQHLHGQKQLIAAAASHHRFTWIHPFLVGNGRVGRLHTDLFFRLVGLGACGIWSLSRGLARSHAEYKGALARADFPRQGDHDGRGALSEKNLISFCEFILNTAIDQVSYMQSLLELQDMNQRIRAYIDDRNKKLIIGLEKIKPEASRLLQTAFIYGQINKSDAADISGLSTSVTRKLVQQLKQEGLLTETSSRSPLRWAIPEHAERYYLPQLSPAR